MLCEKSRLSPPRGNSPFEKVNCLIFLPARPIRFAVNIRTCSFADLCGQKRKETDASVSVTVGNCGHSLVSDVSTCFTAETNLGIVNFLDILLRTF